MNESSPNPDGAGAYGGDFESFLWTSPSQDEQAHHRRGQEWSSTHPQAMRGTQHAG